MKQYRITSDNLNMDGKDDCYLDPNDPIQEIKVLQYLGGINAQGRLHEYKIMHQEKAQGSNISVTGNEKGELMKKHNIKPGTPEWFKLWFSLPYMTGERPVDHKNKGR
jgi:hypothetical protein